MTNLLIVLAILIPGTSVAQSRYEAGKVKQNGGWVNPTPETALDALKTQTTDRTKPAVAVLRQTFEPHSKAGLDALADELGRIIRTGTNAEAYMASQVLRQASELLYGGGVPYARSADVFISVFESFEDRNQPRAIRALHGAFHSGGEEYVRKLFTSSKQPPACKLCGGTSGIDCEAVENPCPNKGPWCQAGGILARNDAKGNGPSLEVWSDLCYRPRL